MQRQTTWHKVQRVTELMSAPREQAHPSKRHETLGQLDRALGSLDEIYVHLPRGSLTPTQFQALRYLAEGGTSTIGALSRATQSTASTTTGLANRLEEQHLVQRSYPETDRRTVTLAVTPEGIHELAVLTAERIDTLDRMLARLSDDDLFRLFGYVAMVQWVVTG